MSFPRLHERLFTDNGAGEKIQTDLVLPSQSGNSGKMLTTDGTSASWSTASIDSTAETVTIGENSLDVSGKLDTNVLTTVLEELIETYEGKN